MPKSRLVVPALFGSLDGMNAALAVLFGTHSLLLPLALTISVGGALSMAAGEFVSALHDQDRSARQELPSSLSMGVATFFGTFLPCVPALILSRIPGIALAVLLGLMMSVGIGVINGAGRPRRAQHISWLISVGVFLFVLIPTALIGVTTG